MDVLDARGLQVHCEHRKPAGWWVGGMVSYQQNRLDRRAKKVADHRVAATPGTQTPDEKDTPPASRLVGLGPILKLRMLGLEFDGDLFAGYDADSK